MSSSDDERERKPPRGPGDDAGAPDLVRRTFWIERDIDERLRGKALEGRTSEGALVREALRIYFGAKRCQKVPSTFQVPTWQVLFQDSRGSTTL